MNTQQNTVVVGHVFNKFSWQRGDVARFTYEGVLRGGIVEKVGDTYIVVLDDLRNAYRTFGYEHLAPAS